LPDHLVELGSVYDAAHRIVFGLCQYVAAARTANATEVWRPVRKGSAKGHASITDEAEVCMVQSHHNFTVEEKAVIHGIICGGGNIAKQISAHFRIGHWRRPPGKGNDPSYPKTVWVRPTLVLRGDLEGPGLPGGSIQMI
jgi:hypothetical protein